MLKNAFRELYFLVLKVRPVILCNLLQLSRLFVAKKRIYYIISACIWMSFIRHVMQMLVPGHVPVNK